MRFKAVLRLERVAELLGLTSVLAKFHRRIILHLTPSTDDRIEFIVAPGSVDIGAQSVDWERDSNNMAVWASLERTQWFSAYQIESKAQDHIALELDPSSLNGALRSASRGQLAQLRLRRKLGSVLSLEIALQEASTSEWDIVQDIAVQVLSPVRLEELHEPPVEAGARGVVLPNPERLYAAAKRLRTFHRHGDTDPGPLHAYLEIAMKRATAQTANLRLWVPADTLQVGMTFTELKVALIDGDSDAALADTRNDGSQLHPDVGGGEMSKQTAKVLVRALARALESHGVDPRQTFCFLLTNCVLLHFAGDDFEVSCYVPHCQEGDEFAVRDTHGLFAEPDLSGEVL
ncbi:hypothetical protein F1559_001652 [Cyanidiococcus yangmingshanensis]|uniref:Checkpoint protein n=1 Tax=Cyanidiococcus yangmingshanensis TaxID=2690220 RepID=A0A7J7IP43_9RHOD|nr:hypothetical protein F1559_001652 [Cyanidiococcus yangmingshanensis]